MSSLLGYVRPLRTVAGPMSIWGYQNGTFGDCMPSAALLTAILPTIMYVIEPPYIYVLLTVEHGSRARRREREDPRIERGKVGSRLRTRGGHHK